MAECGRTTRAGVCGSGTVALALVTGTATADTQLSRSGVGLDARRSSFLSSPAVAAALHAVRPVRDPIFVVVDPPSPTPPRHPATSPAPHPHSLLSRHHTLLIDSPVQYHHLNIPSSSSAFRHPRPSVSHRTAPALPPSPLIHHLPSWLPTLNIPCPPRPRAACPHAVSQTGTQTATVSPPSFPWPRSRMSRWRTSWAEVRRDPS